MSRIAICVVLTALAGCSRESVPNAMDRRADAEIEDGGTFENVDRDKADEYLLALSKVQSAEEEAKLLTEFGEWLREKGYAIKVDVKNGKHDLSCPYFPPVTPWTSHSFIDIKNLELLPRLEDGVQQSVARANWKWLADKREESPPGSR